MLDDEELTWVLELIEEELPAPDTPWLDVLELLLAGAEAELELLDEDEEAGVEELEEDDEAAELDIVPFIPAAKASFEAVLESMRQSVSLFSENQVKP